MSKMELNCLPFIDKTAIKGYNEKHGRNEERKIKYS